MRQTSQQSVRYTLAFAETDPRLKVVCERCETALLALDGAFGRWAIIRACQWLINTCETVNVMFGKRTIPKRYIRSLRCSLYRERLLRRMSCTC